MPTVEVYQHGTMVEDCECSSFDEARQWFEKQWLQNPQLKGHYVGSEHLNSALAGANFGAPGVRFDAGERCLSLRKPNLQ